LLIDLDDVVREFDRSVTAGIEHRYGLTPGSLLGTLLRPDLVRAATLGQITDERWRAAVAAELGGPEAVEEWCRYRGAVRPEVLELVRAVRAAGRPLGLTDEFDAVVNSSVLGVAKPDPAYFAAACRSVDTPPDRCLFVDDQDRNVRGARAGGLSAHRYGGPADLAYVRSALIA
jgi:putative hydrolase of the HAD superfamily